MSSIFASFCFPFTAVLLKTQNKNSSPVSNAVAPWVITTRTFVPRVIVHVVPGRAASTSSAAESPVLSAVSVRFNPALS